MKNKFEDYARAIAIGLIPWVAAFILYKNSQIIISVSILVVFFLLLLASICFRGFAVFLFNTALKISSFLEKYVGKVVGKYLAIIALFFCYIVAVVPTALIMKITRRDRLRLKKPKLESYWIDYNWQEIDYENQY